MTGQPSASSLDPPAQSPNPPISPSPHLPISQSFVRHPGLLLALAVYLTLALSYFFIVPIFEGPDEWTHTGHVAYIAEGNGLPVMLPGRGIWGGQQPPLYFAGGALLVQPFQTEGIAEYAEVNKNPHRSLGYALDPGNKNNYLHSPDEGFPYRGLSLTVHILRLYSIIFGLITLIFTYLTALELYDLRFTIYEARHSATDYSSSRSPKLFAATVALFVATQPMFGFITALVANEPANMAFSAIGLWLAQRYVLRGPSPGWQRAAALGLTLGLISLSKMTGLAFGLVAVVAMLQTAITTRKQPGAALLLWRDGVIIGLLALAVGGWWYWRNYQLYGDFFQEGLYKIYFGVDPQPLTLSDFLYTLSTGEISFWATFGWLNIVAPEWVYSLYRVISRVGLMGVGLAVVVQLIGRLVLSEVEGLAGWKIGRQYISRFTLHVLRFTRPLFPLVIHLIFPVTLAFSLTRLVAIEGGLQGRQLLPALGSMAIVIVWGWAVLTPAQWRRPLFGLVGLLLVGIALWLPYGVVAPHYIPRPLLTEAELPPDLTRLDWRYNEEMKLLGVEIERNVVRPGERVPVTIYWQALQPMTTNYSVFVHLIGRDYRSVGQFNTYPGLGLRPTRDLEPGQIIKDTYPVLVEGGSAAPTRLLVNVGLFDFDEPGRPGIQPLASDGSRPPPTVGWLKLIPNEWPAPPIETPLAEFGEMIQLLDYEFQDCQMADETCHISLTWQATAQPPVDYTVFIQLWPERPPAEGPLFFGFDGPPLNNDYPTSLWATGEVIVDPHPLDLSGLPPGPYRVLSGLYDPLTGDRLPATAQGQPLTDYAVELGVIVVE